MKVKATRSFSGLVTLAKGEERDVREAIAKDLIAAGYAVEVKTPDGGGPPPKTSKGKKEQ